MKPLMSVLSLMVLAHQGAGLRRVTDSSCRCGQRQGSRFNDIFGTRVIGGEEADVNEFPWAALLSIQGKGSKPKQCGGSLVNDR